MTSAHLLGRRGVEWELDEDSGCWMWLKGKSAAGYPHGYAHRRYWEAVNGPRPDGHDIHHLCKTPACVNPEHLAAIDQREHDKLHFLGERAGLTVEDVIEIRRLGTLPGMSSHEVAERFGIGGSTVRYYWRGERWADEAGSEPTRPVGRTCEYCGGPIAAVKYRQARFCNQQHQIAAWTKANRKRAA